MLIVEFIYHNAKKATTGHTFLELHYGNNLCVCFKKNENFCSHQKKAYILVLELQELLVVCRENIYHTQKL